MGQFRKFFNRYSIAALVVMLLVSTGIGFRTEAASAGPAFRFSVYDNVGNTAGVQQVTASLGQPATFGSDYFDDRSWAGIDSDTWLIQRWRATNLSMIWGVPMLPTTGGVSLAAGATGAYNSYFSLLASNLVANGMGNSTLKLGWEFNMPSFPWYAAGQATAFTAYWQQIVTTMRAVPGAHFTFEWNAARGSGGPSDKAMGNYDNYYPGDSYVDVVGLDVYDEAWGTYPGAANEFQYALTQPWGLNWISSFAASHGKPVAIPELGLGAGPSAPNSGVATGPTSVCGGDDPTFIGDVLNWANTNNVLDVVYWDYGTSSINSGSNPQTVAALHQVLTTGTTPLTPVPTAVVPTSTVPTTTTTVPPTTTTTVPPTTTTTVPPTTTTTVPPTTTTVPVSTMTAAPAVTAPAEVEPASPFFVTSRLPEASLGKSYSTLLLAYGGTGPYTFTHDGDLPPGLELRIDGVLAGTPTRTGFYRFTLTATDSESPAKSVAQSFSLSVW